MRTLLRLVFLVLVGSNGLLLAQGIPLRPAEMTNRRLGLLHDASATAWQPSLLGADSRTDIIGAIGFDSEFSLDPVPYGIFAKLWHLGVGITGSTDSSVDARYYAGLGFPITGINGLDLWLGAGFSMNPSASIGDGDLVVSATARPIDQLMVGLSIGDLLGAEGGPRLNFDLLGKPLSWVALRSGFGYSPGDTLFGRSEFSPFLGLDLSLPRDLATLSATYDFNTEQARLGLELPINLLTFGAITHFQPAIDATEEVTEFAGGVLFARYTEGEEEEDVYEPYVPSGVPVATPQRGWAPDRAYIPTDLSYKYDVSDAARDPSAIVAPCDVPTSAFETPTGLVQTVRSAGGPYRALSERLEQVSPAPENLYKSIRTQFYSQRVRSAEIMSGDSLAILSRQGYSIGVQTVDNDEFPTVKVYMQVADNEGQSVRGLTEADFTFADPSIEILSVRPIDSTRRVPVDVTLIIDCSGSMGDEIAAVRTNAQSFVDKMEASGADYRIGGVLYGSIIYDTLHPTSDFTRFREFAANARAIGGDEITTLGVQAASQMNYRPDAQRIFVLITDDWTVQENAKLSEADMVEMLWNTRARLYAILDSCKNNNAVTTRLTLGGEYNIRSSFTSILDELGSDITTSYELVYRSRMREIEKVTILRGRVRDESGRPAGVDLSFSDLAGNTFRIPTNATTGEYETEITEGTRYGVTIGDARFLPLEETIDLGRTRRGDTVVRDFLLRLPETRLFGRILNEKNRGVAGKVQIDDAETLETIALVETDRDGRYETVIDEGRRYRLTPIVPDHIPTPEELDLTGVAKGTHVEKDLHVMSIDEAIATGATFRMQNIFFDFDKSELKPESIPELRKLVTLLSDYPSIRVEIGAHTDAEGSDEYNEALSRRRAQSVVDYLIDAGISTSRLIARGYGETTPVASNDTEEGRAMNRRVEFKLVR